MTSIIDYKPPPTIEQFIVDYTPGALFYDWVVGPVGSGKTTGLFFKLVYLASLQSPSSDGIRRSRAVIVRNTMPQLKDTTIVSWSYWFKEGEAGEWNLTDRKFMLRFGDVECEVLFRPLDTPDDVQRVLSLEVSFAILDEFVQIRKEIVEALSARLGRYKFPDGTKPTIWGMWGSSNPSTEDNWWYDYLHDPDTCETIDLTRDDPDVLRARRVMSDDTRNVRYFIQPSGQRPEAENLENLPGGREYYTNQMKGKSETWVKQFVDAEWGYSVSGKPVVNTFKPELHIAKKRLVYNPLLPLIAGVDPGLAGSAFIFGQQDLHGRLNVLGECVQSGYGAERLVAEVVKPYMRRRFPQANLILAPDPAAANRSQNDEKQVVQTLRKHYPVSIESNNRLPLRLNAIEHFTTRLVDSGAAFQIDPWECPITVRALKGGWRWEINEKKSMISGDAPEKNAYSHPGDALGYLCRYFHKQTERELRYGPQSAIFRPPSFKNTYTYR